MLTLKLHLRQELSNVFVLYSTWHDFFLSRLDLAMNNTQLQCKPLQDILVFFREDHNLKILLTVLYSSLIPLIICANLLLIIGIIKIKRNKFTSCQILFLTLFSSDLTIGIVQLPFLIYRLWKMRDPTCFEAQLRVFFMLFPIIMSGTLLCVISVDRYINVVANKYYKRIVTKKLLPVAIIFMILASLTSVLFGLFKAQGQNKGDITRKAYGFIALSGYFAASIVVGVAFNIALLRYVQRQRKIFSRHQAIDSTLTKTIVMIILLMIATYLPLMITLNIAASGFINSTDESVIQKRVNVRLTMIPCQINAVFNSVIYLSRSSPMKRYYYKLFNCKTVGKCFKRALSLMPDITKNANKQKNPVYSIFVIKAISRRIDLQLTFHQAQTVSPN